MTETEVVPAPYKYPYLRVQIYTHEEDGGFTSRLSFDLEPQPDAQALAWIGKELNRGDEKVGPTYRNAGFPPVGVGDLIVLDWDRHYICQAKGWVQCARPEGMPDALAPEHKERKVKRQ